MHMLAALSRMEPRTNITLHAGELTLGLVPMPDLRFHIREAVEVAGAQRIGHGVDLSYETDSPGLLAEMRRRHVLVEICLSSNDLILNVRGAQHPFMTYVRAGVPVTLATDDEGVSRIDLTHEYERAVLSYGLDYRFVKRLSRASLEYAFLPGASLWSDIDAGRRVAACATSDPAGAVQDACARYLAANERARMQWALERATAAFETAILARG
jgi:adenosine deaminase